MQETVKLAAQYGIGGILALVLGFVMYKIGMRLISAIDEVRKSNVETTKALAEAVGNMSKDVQLAIADAQVANAEALTDLSDRIARVEVMVGVDDEDADERRRAPTPVGGGPFTPATRPVLGGSYQITRRAATGGKKP